MNRILALLLALALLVVGAVLLTSDDAPPASAAPAPSAAADSGSATPLEPNGGNRRVEFPVRLPAESTSIDAAPTRSEASDDGRIRLRSACGLPLRGLERSTDRVHWNPAVLRDGFAHVDEPEQTWFQAAGHSAARIEAGDTELVLQPVLALELRLADLRERLDEVRVEATSWGGWRARYAFHALVEDDAYIFALDQGFARKRFTERPELVVRLRDRSEWVLVPAWEARGEHEIPLDEHVRRFETTVSRVNVVCEHVGAGAAVQCWDPDGSEERRLVARGAWGRLETRRPAACGSYSETVGEEFAHGPIRAGRPYVLTGGCHVGCVGRARFVSSEAAPVTELHLTPAAKIRGVVQAESGSLRPQGLTVEVALSEATVPGVLDSAGSVDEFRIGVGWGGSFEFTLPESVPHELDTAWPPPRFAHLRLRAAGFEPLERVVDLHHAPSWYLGTLRFEPRHFALRVPDGTCVSDSYRSESGLSLLLSGGASVAVVEAVTGPEGELRLYLERDAASEAALERWRELPAAHALLGRGSSFSYAFVRIADDALACAPLVRAQVNVYPLRDPPDQGSFHLGYRWNDLDVVWSRVGLEDIGSGFTVLMNAPEGPLRLWWNTSPTPPTAASGGWGEYDDGRGSITIE